MSPVLVYNTALRNFTRQDDLGEQCQGRTRPRRSVTIDEMDILADLFRGKTVLEFGTGIGVSSGAIASTAVWVYTFDPDPWVAGSVAQTLPKNVTFSARHSDETADAAFIDGDHSYESALKDMEKAMCFTDMDPCVIHDSHMAEVRDAIAAAGLRIERDFGPPCFMAVVSR